MFAKPSWQSVFQRNRRLFSSASNTNLRVALEWTPNTNHIGFYVARANGYYSESNLLFSMQLMTDISS